MTIFQEAILPPGCVRQRNDHCLHFLSKSFWWSTCPLISTYLWNTLEIWKIPVEYQEYKILGPQNPNKIIGKKPQGLCRALFGVHEDEIHNRIAKVRLYYPADLISQFISFAVPREFLTDSKPALVTTSHKVHKIWGEDK